MCGVVLLKIIFYFNCQITFLLKYSDAIIFSSLWLCSNCFGISVENHLPRQKKNQFLKYVWAYFWILHSVPLINMSILTPKPNCLDC